MKKAIGVLILIILSGNVKAQFCPDGVGIELMDHSLNVLCNTKNSSSLRLQGFLKEGTAYFMGGAHTFSWTHNGSGSFSNQSANPVGASMITYNIAPQDYSQNNGIVRLSIEVTIDGSFDDCATKVLTANYFLILYRYDVSAGPDQTLCAVSGTSVPISATVSNANSVGSFVSKWRTLGSGTFDNENLAATNYIPSLADVNSGSVKLIAKVRRSQCLANDGVADTLTLYFETCTDLLKSTKRESLQIYPNPVSDYLIVKGEENMQEGLLKIYNSSGALVYEKQISKESTIPVQLPKGIYNAVLFAGEKVSYRKFEVQ